MRALLVFLTLTASPAVAVPIFAEPCEVKTLVTRKASPVAGKESPILAWVTVRSGRPHAPDKTCTDETIAFDVAEPSMLDFEPYADYSALELTEEEPEAWSPPPSRVEWWPYWEAQYVIMRHPPQSPPTGHRPPPRSVPEPGTGALFAIAACVALLARRRKRS